MKKIVFSLITLASLSFAMSNEELAQELKALKSEIKEMKQEQSETNDAILEEVTASSIKDGSTYKSFSSLGIGASKVYHTSDTVSIGGYGEYKFKKYSDYKNTTNAQYNDNKNKGEYNIVRFVPYIGFKFNEWIVMNTEIEFEDGGARSDNTKNYKYAIVEFSYLDFLLDDSFAIRVGHILVPFGLINLNHEPVAYLTSDRPAVETYIIPSTWHTNGLLTHGRINSFEYYAGVITSPDSDGFGDAEGRFIQQGRLGAKQYTDSFSFVARASYDFGSGINAGASFVYGTSQGSTSKVDTTMMMGEAHVTYINNGFNIQALASYGTLGGDIQDLPTSSGLNIADAVNGQYITFGYDIAKLVEFKQTFYLVAEVERLDMDMNNKTTYSDNNKFLEYTGGVAYFPDPRVVLKADYKLRDYGSDAKLADENSFTLSAGFIF